LKVGFLGQVIPTKGVTELVTACSLIIDIELILIGPVETTYKEKLKNISLAKKNGEWLKFTGEIGRNKALCQISYLDIFALPSYREAFPLSILEAMGLSKPIVATDVGAISKMLDINGGEQCGLCFKPKDSDGLKRALLELLNNDKLRNQMGNYSRKRVEKLYSSKIVFPKLINHWSELII